MKFFFEYTLIFAFYKISRLIGINLSSLLGGIILYFYGFFSKRNSIAIRNLSYAFPYLSQIEKKKIIRRMWFHFGRVVGEYPHLHKIKIKNNKKIKIIGLNNLLEPLKNEKNCIYFSAHIGNWELSSHPLVQNGYKINFIYRAPNNHYVDNLLRKIRQNYGVKLIKKGKEGAKDCIKALKKKENLGMLIDQKMNDGVSVNFFGHQAMTPTAIAKFALKFKCPIVPALCIREENTTFRIEYLKPIKYQFIKKMGSEKKILTYLNKIIEEWIIKYPDQWIWVHDRWKS